MNNQIKYSIIIPVYNAKKYLDDCLKSIVLQIRDDCEVLIVDDGSKDGSETIYNYYAEKYPQIRVIVQENQGVYAARQNGICQATGEYLLFVDADDYWQQDALKVIDRQLSAISADILIFNFQKVYGNGRISEYPVAYTEKYLFDSADLRDFYKNIVFGKYFNSLSTKVIKRSIVKDCSIFRDQRVAFGEDLLQSITLLDNVKTICYIPDVLYNYRINQESASFHFDIKRLNDSLFVYEYLFNQIYQRFGNEKDLRNDFWRSFFSLIFELTLQFWSQSKLHEIFKWNALVRGSQLISDGLKERKDWECPVEQRVLFSLVNCGAVLLPKILGLILKKKKQHANNNYD